MKKKKSFDVYIINNYELSEAYTNDEIGLFDTLIDDNVDNVEIYSFDTKIEAESFVNGYFCDIDDTIINDKFCLLSWRDWDEPYIAAVNINI